MPDTARKMGELVARPRSLRLRLSLLFGGIALVAMGFVYLAVVPGLKSSLVADKLSDLDTAARLYSRPIERAVGTSVDAQVLDRLVRSAADRSSTRVTLFNVNHGTELQTYIASDSSSEVEINELSFEVADQAARSGRPAAGTEAASGGRVGEAARPIFYTTRRGREVGSVLVYSAPLRDAERSVAVVRRRVLAATAIALLVALVAGAVIARQISRRVQRLEAAATRVAAGDFTARFPAGRDDELGQLARTLDDMRRQLAEVDSARKRFIATASHELRTPIFSLGGYLELLQDEELDEETRDRFLTQVREQVARLGRLATELLDLSRLEAGSLELRAEPVDLREVARLVASEFEPALQGHRSHLELRLPTEEVRAVCDPERVTQVLRILIDNALTHTPPGTDVVVSAGRRDGRARVGVGDFGPGIKRTMLPHIFEPFVTSDDAGGSGLGLAIAHELAGRMDGELAVESQPGRTTFTLELPA
jgi:signal transduction histidine kinase